MCSIFTTCAVTSASIRRFVTYPPPRQHYGGYAEAQADDPTAQDYRDASHHNHEAAGLSYVHKGSYGWKVSYGFLLPPKHCQGTCQSGVCTLSPRIYDPCFEF
jgi:hypothetical protein